MFLRCGSPEGPSEGPSAVCGSQAPESRIGPRSHLPQEPLLARPATSEHSTMPLVHRALRFLSPRVCECVYA